MPEPSTFALGYIAGKTVTSAFMSSVLAVIGNEDTGPRCRAILHREGPYIPVNRNLVVADFLQTELEWLVFVDTDMAWGPEHIRRLLDLGEEKICPVVGGLYFNTTSAKGRWTSTPLLYRVGPTGEHVRLLDYPQNTLLPVDVIPTGASLIHRTVYERLAAKFGRSWYSFEDDLDSIASNGRYQMSGEDVAFSNRCRELLIPLHIHTGIVFGHDKTMRLTDDTYDPEHAKEIFRLGGFPYAEMGSPLNT